MKLKITITGPKVHDVGYRYFLMSNAIDLGLRGFHARNRANENEQEVIALVEGDEEAVDDFKKLVTAKKPEQSEVSKIAFGDYTGEIMHAGEYAQVCSALQLNKAIPLLLDMRDDLKAVRTNTDTIPKIAKNTEKILEEVKGLREDIQPGFGMQFRQLQADMKAVKDRLGMP